MNPMNLVCTNTTRLIIPMLFQNSTFDKILNKNFVDSYSFDYYEPNYDNKIIIVKNIDIPPETNCNLIGKYKRQNHYCFVYDIPNEFKKDYNFITRNNYNLISNEYIDRLMCFWGKEGIFTTSKYNPIREMYRVY